MAGNRWRGRGCAAEPGARSLAPGSEPPSPQPDSQTRAPAHGHLSGGLYQIILTPEANNRCEISDNPPVTSITSQPARTAAALRAASAATTSG
jgi:hypothetical protein